MYIASLCLPYEKKQTKAGELVNPISSIKVHENSPWSINKKTVVGLKVAPCVKALSQLYLQGFGQCHVLDACHQGRVQSVGNGTV